MSFRLWGGEVPSGQTDRAESSGGNGQQAILCLGELLALKTNRPKSRAIGFLLAKPSLTVCSALEMFMPVIPPLFL